MEFPFQVSSRSRERRLLDRRMTELLEQIERLERVAADDAPAGAASPDDAGRSGRAAINATVAELRSQLRAMMARSLELEEDAAEPRGRSASVPGSPRPPTPTSARDAPPAAHPDAVSGHPALPFEPGGPLGIAAAAGGAVNDAALEYRIWGTGSQLHTDGLSIRVIPPNPTELGPDGQGRSVTLVFDLGASQPPIRVSLPVDPPAVESRLVQPDYGPVHQSFAPRLGPRRRLVGAMAVAALLVLIGFLGAVWVGAVMPNQAAATAQPPRNAALPPPAAVSGEARALREQPAVGAPVVAWIANGTRVEVLDGMELADGYAWLRVRTADGKAGWVASVAQGAASSPTPVPTAVPQE